ncbi:MAG TPA: nucleotide disphospho-sugar-binding domain-containing protein [Puia sp.]|nr:nucleotide disphospho-sugar-binding domain-containing protein [Puia sp.]
MKESIKNQLKGKKILFATVPAEGHFNPLTGLARFLQSQGCDVRWYTSEIFTEKLGKLGIPHYTFIKAVDINPTNFMEKLPERNAIQDPAAKLEYDLIHLFGNRSEEYYEDIQALYGSFPFDGMVADNTFSAIPFVRYKMNIPVVSIGVLPLAEDSVDLAPYGMALPPATTAAERSTYAEFRNLGVDVLFKRSIDNFDAILNKHSIPHKNSLLLDLLIREAVLYLQIGIPSFEYQRSDLSANIRFVGALLPYATPRQGRSWYDERLEKHSKIVLVTQGTVETDIQKILVPTLEAFKGTDVLVIATTGGSKTGELREKYPFENFIIEDYIPFDDVMPHADVYVTNGGYSGTLLSIKHNLPIVAAGVHEGKSEVCARIGYFNLGIDLKTEVPSPEAIRKAVNRILVDSSYKDSITRLAEEINRYNANELSAGYLAELLSLSFK